MPDILIRGMEMPRTCSDCSMCYDMMECTVSPLRFWYGRPENEQFDFCKERHPSCPLVELPEHGALIDRDRLMEDGWVLHKEVIRMGGYAIHEQPLNYPDIPVIVPASEEATNDPKP